MKPKNEALEYLKTNVAVLEVISKYMVGMDKKLSKMRADLLALKKEPVWEK